MRPYIKCFYNWEVNLHSAEPVLFESPPSGYSSMVINYGNQYEVSSAKKDFLKTDKAFIAGQATKNYHFRISQSFGAVGIVFYPSALASVFGFQMYEFTDERHDLEAVLGKEILTLRNQIEDAPSAIEKINCLINYLTATLIRKKITPDKIDRASQLIISHNGNININDLLGNLYISRRPFERNFLTKVGVSPKYFARLTRISILCNLLASKKWEINDWQEVISHFGYYDQAHFIKDFSSFTQKSPKIYLKNNKELSRWLG